MTDTKRAAIIKKIRALLNMSLENGCTENEAIIAAEKADELMLEYNLETKDIEEIESERWGKRGKSFVGGSYKRRSYHPVSNCHGSIAKFTDCRVFYSGPDLVFFGTDHGTEFAHYLNEMIRASMDIEYKKAEPVLKAQAKRDGYRVHGKTLRTSFLIGMAQRINERLTQLKYERDQKVHNHSTESTGTSLVVVTNQVLERKFQQLGLNLVSKASQRGKNIHGSSFKQGRDAGDRINLGRPVGGRGGDRARLN